MFLFLFKISLSVRCFLIVKTILYDLALKHFVDFISAPQRKPPSILLVLSSTKILMFLHQFVTNKFLENNFIWRCVIIVNIGLYILPRGNITCFQVEI